MAPRPSCLSGLQQVSFNRPVDYGGPGTSNGVSLRPERTDVVNARTFRHLPEALLTDGDTVQDQKGRKCPRSCLWGVGREGPQGILL